MSKCKLLYVEWIKKVLLYSIENYTQYLVINHNGKEKKDFVGNTEVDVCLPSSNDRKLLLLPLLSHFSRVRLCATPQTAAHQAPPSLGFSRQEYWSGLPFPSPMKVKSESEVAQSCLTLRDPMDCSPPGSSVHGIFQAGVLEWGATAFFDDRQRSTQII